MPASESEVLVGRRYLARGFLDAALKLFVRNASLVTRADWSDLADRLMERNRIADVVRVCELGSVPLPKERMLAQGDAHLRRKDVDTTIRLYELGEADRERWSKVVDALAALPERERQAIDIAERHLSPELPAQAPGRPLKAVK
jgi:DNA-directed RNA polymerase specialized sigma24 family protein